MTPLNGRRALLTKTYKHNTLMLYMM